RRERRQFCRLLANLGGIFCAPADIEPHVAAFDPTQFLQPLSERAEPWLIVRIVLVRQDDADKAYPLRLLSLRRVRTCGGGANQRDELAPPHSITSSARVISDDGTVRPSALAAFKLIVSSYFVGACTGKSAGFSPLRIRST